MPDLNLDDDPELSRSLWQKEAVLYESLHDMDRAIDALENDSFSMQSNTMQAALLSLMKTAKATAAATLGECRAQLPTSPLTPVIDANGKFMWVCTHRPTPHTS
jgi:hypothetical protein